MKKLPILIAAVVAQTEPSGLNHPVLDTYFRHGNAIVVWNKEQAKGVERP